MGVVLSNFIYIWLNGTLEAERIDYLLTLHFIIHCVHLDGWPYLEYSVLIKLAAEIISNCQTVPSCHARSHWIVLSLCTVWAQR